MTAQITQEMEKAAHEDKIDINDAQYQLQKIKQYFEGSNQDSTSLDKIAKLAPAGYKYAFISILDEKNQHNHTAIFNAKDKGYREVPKERHPELNIGTNANISLKDCALYKDFYIFEIEEFVLKARDQKELRDNKFRADSAVAGYNVNMGKGIVNDYDKTKMEVNHGALKEFVDY